MTIKELVLDFSLDKLLQLGPADFLALLLLALPVAFVAGYALNLLLIATGLRR